VDVDDAPLGRLTFLPRSWSISASMSSIVSRLLLPNGRSQKSSESSEADFAYRFATDFFGGSSSDSSSAFEPSLFASVVTVRLRPFTALCEGVSMDDDQVYVETYAARVERARFAGGESETLDPALSSLSSSEPPRLRLD
jgi:hypothetical protein